MKHCIGPVRSFFPVVLEVIYSNTRGSVSSDFQTPRRELKIRRVAKYEVSGNVMKHCQLKVKLRSKRTDKIVKIYAN